VEGLVGGGRVDEAMTKSQAVDLELAAPVVFFDGVCNLCNGTIQFLLWADREERLHFASVQSVTGQRVLGKLRLPASEFETMMFFERGRIHFRSTAVLQIFRYLPWFFKIGLLFLLIPRVLRDGIYRWVAKNRYSIFGKQDHCMLPTPELATRFLD